MIRPPSSIVGTTPLGFMSRYHFWSLPPYCSPTFSRSYLSPHSSAHHSTFMTLIEFARPQIFISLPFHTHLTLRSERASVSKGGHEHLVCCPSFETAASRPPQDEDFMRSAISAPLPSWRRRRFRPPAVPRAWR